MAASGCSTRRETAAKKFRSSRLKRLMFTHWQRYVERIKQRRIRHVQALVFWSRNLEHRCFHSWVQCTSWYSAKLEWLFDLTVAFAVYSTADSIRHANNMHIAKVHFRLRRKRIALRGYVLHAEGRRIADRAMLAAAAFWEDHRRAKALKCLQENVERCKTRELNIMKAESFCRRALIKRYWGALRRFSESVHLRTLTATNRAVVLVQQRERRVLTSAFKAWPAWLQRRAQRRLNTLRADAIRHRRLKQRSFVAWREWAYSTHAERVVKRHVLYLYARSRLKKTFLAWKRLWLDLKVLRQAAEKMAMGKEISVKRRMVEMWKQFVDMKRTRREREDFALEWRRRELLKNGVRVWITNSMNFKMQKEALIQQQSALKATLVMKRVAKYAHHWRRITLERKLQRENFSKSVEYVPSSFMTPPTLHTPPAVQIHEPRTTGDVDWMQPRSKPRPEPRKFVVDEDMENLVGSMNQP